MKVKDPELGKKKAKKDTEMMRILKNKLMT